MYLMKLMRRSIYRCAKAEGEERKRENKGKKRKGGTRSEMNQLLLIIAAHHLTGQDLIS